MTYALSHLQVWRAVVLVLTASQQNDAQVYRIKLTRCDELTDGLEDLVWRAKMPEKRACMTDSESARWIWIGW